MNTNVVVIGCGYWGPNLVRNFYQLPGCRLVAFCDLDQGRLANMQRMYHDVRLTTDYVEILGDPEIDAVVIATPPQTHYQLAKKALGRGKHVLIEKPLALRSTEAKELIRLAQKQGKVLMVGHTFEYSPAVRKIKELIDSGEIGNLCYITSTRANLGRVQKDFGALWSIAPHDISIVNHIMGRMPLEVSAWGGSFLHSPIEDVVFLNLLFPDNVLAHVHVTWLAPSKIRAMSFVGSGKMISYDDVDSEAKIKVYDKSAFKIGDEVYGEFHYRLHSGDIHIPHIDTSEPLRNECAHFLDCVQQGKKPQTDGENGLRVVRVLEAAERSLQNRGAVIKIQ